MIGLAFAPAINSPHKKDAQEFRHEAAKWAQTISPPASVVLVDNTAPRALRRRRILQRLEQQERLDVLALFCHGSKRGLTSFGFDVGTVGDLAEHIAALGTRTVILYACSTAMDSDAEIDDEREPGPGGDGGFADVLRETLMLDHGSTARVYGHSIVGHTTRCPYVRFFDASTGAGGQWLIAPDSDLWPKWRRAMRETDLRFRFPLLSQAEIEAELRG